MNRQEAIRALRTAGKGRQVMELISERAGRGDAAYRAIDADASLSDQGKAQRLAGAYSSIMVGLDRELEKMAQQVIRIDRDDASYIFGTAGLSGDPASLIISQRDAADRVASAQGREELQELLTRATRSGDEVLARAVVERAVRDLDEQTVNAFIAERPDTDAAVNRLWNAQRAESSTLEFNAALLGVRPAQLMGMSEDSIAQLAYGSVDAAATGSGGRAIGVVA